MNRIRSKHYGICFFVALSLAVPGQAAQSEENQPLKMNMHANHQSEVQSMTENPEHSQNGDPYSLSICMITKQKLGAMGKPVTSIYNEREIKFCCQGCLTKFNDDPVQYLQDIDNAMIEDQRPYYPMQRCLISGTKFSETMGKPIDYIHNNRLFRFCCPACVAQFSKEPDKYLKRLNQSVIKNQIDSYPLETCVVSGCLFRPNRPLIPILFGHRFRRKSATLSGFNRPLSTIVFHAAPSV